MARTNLIQFFFSFNLDFVYRFVFSIFASKQMKVYYHQKWHGNNLVIKYSNIFLTILIFFYIKSLSCIFLGVFIIVNNFGNCCLEPNVKLLILVNKQLQLNLIP